MLERVMGQVFGIATRHLIFESVRAGAGKTLYPSTRPYMTFLFVGSPVWRFAPNPAGSALLSSGALRLSFA